MGNEYSKEMDQIADTRSYMYNTELIDELEDDEPDHSEKVQKIWNYNVSMMINKALETGLSPAISERR